MKYFDYTSADSFEEAAELLKDGTSRRNTPTQTDLLGGDSPEVGMTIKEETK